MDRETIVCTRCDSLVPLADNIREDHESHLFVCPVCHEASPVGALGVGGYERSDVEGLGSGRDEGGGITTPFNAVAAFPDAATVRAAVARGLVAGVVGKVALDTVTYLDMLVRGRPPSDLPERAAVRLADRMRFDLAGGGDRGNRRAALASLLGYATGAVMGAVYGALRHDRSMNWRPAGLAAGLGALAGTALPSTASGLTDPRRWGLTGWLEDLVPHLAYGLVTARTYEALTPR